MYKLNKALYGLKQAPRAWYERPSKFLMDNKFEREKVDTIQFLKKKDESILVVQIYVDDVIFGDTIHSLCEEFTKLMQGEFEMSMMEELNFFLGLQIKQDKEGIFINQTKYIRQIIKRFDISGKHVGTLMSYTCKLDRDEDGKKIDQKLYQDMIGSLLYLMASRSDIIFSVCMYGRYQSDPRESHLLVTKRIFRYLNGTQNVGLWYSKNSSLDVLAYSDSDFVGCKLDRKSTSGVCHFLERNLISWLSRKQNSIALSSTEVEYVAVGSCCAQILWIKYQLADYGIELNKVSIRCDNKSAINLSKNLVLHSRTKHIDIRHHFLKEQVFNGNIFLDYICTED